MSGGGTYGSGACTFGGSTSRFGGGGGGGGGGALISSMMVAVSGFLITSTALRASPVRSAQITRTCTATTNTIPIQLHSVNLNMPVGNPPPPLVLPEVVKIDVDPQSRVYWNGEWLPTRKDLEERLQGAAAKAVQPELHLRPDKAAKYEVVAGVLASSQRLGLTKIGIVGSEQFIE